MRWGLGPVFLYECLANSRRWQTYAIRSAGVALLLAAIATIAMQSPTIDPRYAWREYAALGVSYFYGVIGVELALVMLAAPAATAGAICVDRARGTLAHMLATDLSDPEIVLGKLAARLLPVLGLVACSWPVMALSSLLGGIDPQALTLAFAIILAVALLGCSMAMALSVWARKPHEVVLVVYTFWRSCCSSGRSGTRSPWRSSSARRPAGASWRTRTTWHSHRIRRPVGSISGAISVSSQRRWGQPSRWRSWRSGGCGPSRGGGPTKAARGPGSAGSAGCRDGCPARRSTAIPCSGASGIGRGRRAGRRS